MNRFKISRVYCHLVLGALIGFASCKKAQTVHPATNVPNADVYIVGSVTAGNGVTVAAYWKNGALVKLGDSVSVSFANSILVNGADIYVGGSSVIQGTQATAATYWKNGVATTLTDGKLQSSVTGMTFAGNNLYLSGNSSYPNGNSIAEHWVNTAASIVIDSPTLTVEQGIGVIGQNVYISGFNSIQDVSSAKGAYLKNGQPTFLQPNTLPLSLTLSGNDVYQCGGTSPDSLWNNSVVTFWKNGVATKWGDSNGYTIAQSIAVSGTDVYLAGSSGHSLGTPPQAVYWKNGTPTTLSGSTSEASGIAVLGNDVYVTGEINGKPGYWLNGVPVILGSTGSPSQIVVVPRILSSQ
jgi:hypothetical protein